MDENKRKKHTWLWDILAVVGGMLGIGGVLVLIQMLPALIFIFAMATTPPGDELLLTTTSPQGMYTLEVHQINPGATEPFYIRVLRTDGGRKERVYQVRGQSEAEVIWLSEDVAEINGVPVNLAKGDHFTANARGYITVKVQVEAEDVRRLELTVCMDREPRITRQGTWVQLPDSTDAWSVSACLNVLQELHWDDDFTQKLAGLTVTVTSANGQTFTLPCLWEWKAKEYGSYNFILTGSADEGYTLSPENVKCTVTRMEDTHE